MSESEAIRFPVAGMTCVSCVNRITRSLRRVDGVSSVRVDLGRETVTVGRDAGRVADGALATAIADAGYEADVVAAVPVPNTPGVASRLVARFRRRTR